MEDIAWGDGKRGIERKEGEGWGEEKRCLSECVVSLTMQSQRIIYKLALTDEKYVKKKKE